MHKIWSHSNGSSDNDLTKVIAKKEKEIFQINQVIQAKLFPLIHHKNLHVFKKEGNKVNAYYKATKGIFG